MGGGGGCELRSTCGRAELSNLSFSQPGTSAKNPSLDTAEYYEKVGGRDEKLHCMLCILNAGVFPPTVCGDVFECRLCVIPGH